MHLYQATYKVKGETRRSKIWKLEYRDESGRRRRKSLETENRKEAESRARELLDRIAVKKEKRRAEMIGERELRPPEVLLPEYRAELERRGCGKQHVSGTITRVRRLVLGLKSLDDVTPTLIKSRLGRIKAEGNKSATLTRFRGAGPHLCVRRIIL